MKLASLYSPSAHKIINNPFFEYYQTFFHDGFREPIERNPSKEIITKKKYEYVISEAEKEFFEKMYVQQGKLLNLSENHYLKQVIIESGIEHQIGEHIKDLFDFLLDIQDNLGLLIAPIGWGKTALLRYAWFYLINKSRTLSEQYIPIYISIDHNGRNLRNGLSTEEIKKIFVQQMLLPRMKKICQPFTKLDDEDFWLYIKNSVDAFSDLLIDEEDILDVYKDDLSKATKKIKLLRKDAKRKDDFYYATIKYLRESIRKTPILILDNVDTLSLKSNEVILDEALYLSREYNLKVLISMRKSTYEKIEETREGMLRAYPPIRIVMEAPNVKDYVDQRISIIKKNIINSVPLFDSLNYKDKKISFNDGNDLYDKMLSMLVGDESVKLLLNLANSNLRKVNSLILKYLATGNILHSTFMDNLLYRITMSEVKKDDENSNVKKIYPAPLWILASTVITNNYRTRFSSVGMNHQEGVINLYCNGRKHLGDYFTRIYLLNYLKRMRNTSLHDIRDDYLALYDGNEELYTNGLYYALWRLLDFELLESPDCFKVDDWTDINLIKTIFSTDVGEYYRLEFRNFYEYLIYMKDDVEIEENKFGIKDCIKVSDFDGRCNQLISFFKMLISAEKDFLYHRDGSQRKVLLEKFSFPEDGEVSILKQPLLNMKNFLGARDNVDSSITDEFNNLLLEVDEYVSKIYPK